TAKENTALALGDFNGDGKIDLAVADSVKRSVTVILQSSARPDRTASSTVSSEATRTPAILAATPQASVLAATSCATPHGTTLTESFGDSAARCWAGGPASCDQLWAVGSLSAQSINATPAGAPANTACSNSLPMNETSGTRGYVYTTGTFPPLPAGTTFDVFFTLYISSSSLGAYRIEPLFYASQDKGGGASAGIIDFYANGSTL